MTSIDSCCAFQWPVHVEIPLAVAHRRSRRTLHGLVQPCARWDITPLAHHRHDLDLVLPPKSMFGPSAEAVWPFGPAKHGCTSGLIVLWDHRGQPGRTGRLDASKYEAGRWICLPRCQSPDVSLAHHAAHYRSPLRLAYRTRPCETAKRSHRAPVNATWRPACRCRCRPSCTCNFYYTATYTVTVCSTYQPASHPRLR